MQSIRVVAIPTEIADAVRSTMQAPGYGFPAHKEVGEEAAPCRHLVAGQKRSVRTRGLRMH